MLLCRGTYCAALLPSNAAINPIVTFVRLFMFAGNQSIEDLRDSKLLWQTNKAFIVLNITYYASFSFIASNSTSYNDSPITVYLLFYHTRVTDLKDLAKQQNLEPELKPSMFCNQLDLQKP